MLAPLASALAYVTGDHRIVVRGADTGEALERPGRIRGPRLHDRRFEAELSWSPDGRRLLVLHKSSIHEFGRGALNAGPPLPGGRAAEYSPDGESIALVRSAYLGHGPKRSELVVIRGEGHDFDVERLFSGPGHFTDVAWSPDGRWLLVAWREADQWLFIRPDRPKRIVAVGDILAPVCP